MMISRAVRRRALGVVLVGCLSLAGPPTGGASGDGGGKRRREPVATEERTGPRQFAREVRSELRKVSWPTRAEVINYSLVVFFTVLVLTVLIAVLDWLFSSSLLKLFET